MNTAVILDRKDNTQHVSTLTQYLEQSGFKVLVSDDWFEIISLVPTLIFCLDPDPPEDIQKLIKFFGKLDESRPILGIHPRATHSDD